MGDICVHTFFLLPFSRKNDRILMYFIILFKIARPSRWRSTGSAVLYGRLLKHRYPVLFLRSILERRFCVEQILDCWEQFKIRKCNIERSVMNDRSLVWFRHRSDQVDPIVIVTTQRVGRNDHCDGMEQEREWPSGQRLVGDTSSAQQLRGAAANGYTVQRVADHGRLLHYFSIEKWGSKRTQGVNPTSVVPV